MLEKKLCSKLYEAKRFNKTTRKMKCTFIRHGGKHDWYQNPEQKYHNQYQDIEKLKNILQNALSKC